MGKELLSQEAGTLDQVYERQMENNYLSPLFYLI